MGITPIRPEIDGNLLPISVAPRIITKLIRILITIRIHSSRPTIEIWLRGTDLRGSIPCHLH